MLANDERRTTDEEDGLFEHPARCSPLSQTCEPVKFWSAHIVFPQPANGERKDESFYSLASCLSPPARAAGA